MNYLNRMYGRGTPPPTKSEKNPNRVAGGIRGQGGDAFEIIAEDGTMQKIPTQRYVQSLEEQIKVQRGVIAVLEKKMNRMTRSVETLEGHVSRMGRKG
jgi:hypothetical protein